MNKTSKPDLYLMGSHVVGYTLPLNEYIQDQWKRGALKRVNADGTLWAGNEYAGVPEPQSAAPDPEPSDLVPDRPRRNASRLDWANYTARIGAATAEEADKLTRDELIDLTTPPEMKPDAGE